MKFSVRLSLRNYRFGRRVQQDAMFDGGQLEKNIPVVPCEVRILE